MRHSRSTSLVFSLFAVFGGALNAGQPPLNILVLYADDWRFDTLGCAGNTVVQTPHLDQLASEGLRFLNNYVTTSICGVSRASLLTGQWMSRHGNPAFAMFKTPWAETYPGVLRAHGYRVGHIGKWHNGKFPGQHFDFGRSYQTTHWQQQPDGSKIHVTQKNEQDALEFLRTQPPGQPFCLTVAFFAPHAEDANPRQYLPQPSSMALYQDALVPVPATASADGLRRLPPFIRDEKNEGRVRYHLRFDTPAKYQEMMKNYYRLCTEVDAAVGRILAELREKGMLDQTLIVFTSDNGYFHGERGLADKWYPYEESIRTPLIIRDPRLPASQRGRAIEAITLNVDLAPTFIAAALHSAPTGMQGQDLSPLYLSATPAHWRTAFFYEHATIGKVSSIPSSQALVQRDTKYIYWPDFGYEEWFDLNTDPSESHNLVDHPGRAAELVQLRSRFNALKQQSR
jgi:arylsulfatase A-like enzyme